ncbi:5'(3')-deoxyribonucleotidase [Clostridium acetobutylicum]|uniref:5'(3')-deoxyribonucleotidase n=1 Tax=Clostridium acetobutylicum (strain ATCC 824 / DSM 792 / JCM 1419 / IAM 19013 / LMG 5710 / NBRC 13948 / NRRL B-527 / VKM B-1787 / 2291 / W) TaxID=272562 RepID=53DR_CLOAB|nr:MULTISPECIES: 5'-3'-deoxyribonucleotidase [Clostridium]Q97JQ5.1 RecName: Full=5'(3')-deoxyribonucleotidase [Clostridium acetobutylicum ATCC 824]AAK79190.1 Phage related protein, YorS B.subtilis homolog [Clostridium acetobutylicum ATCC 824]ADZ20268.1 Phage related protein [Clostridium acetobutylicum EA 2018]AEI31720.1 hypothetical protein SMB_G1238 [Clostridium acetobutylicum DSM 1731]AWV81560.1 5'-3'-deoxyribonucleotidase [Clostridium acetobutylicum]MBC2393200.1 5'-3'-deoxyribonucleotidase
MNKPTLGIDLDTTLNTLDREWVKRYNEIYKDKLLPSDIKGWDIENYVKPECGKKIYDILKEPHFFRNLGVQPFAETALEELTSIFNIYIVSATHYKVCEDKGNWIKEKFPFISYQNIIFCHNKGLVHLDILIDDNPLNLENFKGNKILFDAHHNKSENRFVRARDWYEAKALCESLKDFL